MKKTKHAKKSHHPNQHELSHKTKLQQQLKSVRRRRLVTSGLGVFLFAGLLIIEYFRDVPAWLYVMLWVVPFLLVLDTVYLKYLREQIAKH